MSRMQDDTRNPAVSSEHIPDSAPAQAGVSCPECGSPYVRRVRREGFLQTRIYSRFGYYPWECAICRKTNMLKVRGKRRHRSSEE